MMAVTWIRFIMLFLGSGSAFDELIPDDGAILGLPLERQAQELQEHLHRQRLGDVDHEIAAPAVDDPVDELVRQRPDAVLERQHGLGRKRLLQRRAVLGVLGRIEVDRNGSGMCGVPGGSCATNAFICSSVTNWLEKVSGSRDALKFASWLKIIQWPPLRGVQNTGGAVRTRSRMRLCGSAR